jgi:hypothetical protein
MFTIVGYSASLNTAGVLTAVAALTDQHVRVQGNDIIVPALNQYLGAYHTAISASRAQLRTPSIRRVLNPEIKPLNLAAGITNNPPPDPFFAMSPVPLVTNEAMDMYVAGTEGAAEQKTAVVLLGDGPTAPVVGPIYTVRATASVTLVAFAWTLGTLTLDQTLPLQNYNIVGARCQSAGLIAFRFVFVGGIWRPGGIGVSDVQKITPYEQRFGRWGVWGSFNALTPPAVEFLSATADAAETLDIDLMVATG